VSGAAQAIFNPGQPVAPMQAAQAQPKAPSGPMANKGTAATTKDEGWGSTK